MNWQILYAGPGQRANQSVQQQLELAGYSVLVAGDIAAARQLVQTEPVDLVIIEMSISSFEGFDLPNCIRSLSSSNKLPVIILGTVSGEDECVRGLEAGADGFIARPFTPAVLLAQINALLRRVRRVNGSR